MSIKPNRAVFASAFLLLLGSSSAGAAGICGFLSGNAATLCRAAEQIARKQAKPAEQSVADTEESPSTNFSSILEKAIAQDALAWNSNRYDARSLHNVTATESNGETLLHGEYTYNGGKPATVDAQVRGAQVKCLKYWDRKECLPVRTGQSVDSGRRTIANRTSRGAAPAVAAPPQDPNIFRPEKFYGVDVWVNAFDKAANNPKDFKTFLGGMVETANGADAKAYGMVTGPQRNFYQKFLTDYQYYTGIHRSRSALLSKAQQCVAKRDFTAAEACDCVAGFAGDTLIGPGAGELVTESNAKIGIAACGTAASLATEPRLKARYIAQRARAQVYTTNTFQAIQWTDEAIQLGYARASIVKASAALRDFEFTNSGFPPPSQAQNAGTLKLGADFLKSAKKANVWETFIVAQQYKQALSIFKFNSAVLTPLFKSMMTPPPASTDRDDCELRPVDRNGAGGVVYGMRCG